MQLKAGLQVHVLLLRQGSTAAGTGKLRVETSENHAHVSSESPHPSGFSPALSEEKIRGLGKRMFHLHADKIKGSWFAGRGGAFVIVVFGVCVCCFSDTNNS